MSIHKCKIITRKLIKLLLGITSIILVGVAIYPIVAKVYPDVGVAAMDLIIGLSCGSYASFIVNQG